MEQEKSMFDKFISLFEKKEENISCKDIKDKESLWNNIASYTSSTYDSIVESTSIAYNTTIDFISEKSSNIYNSTAESFVEITHKAGEFYDQIEIKDNFYRVLSKVNLNSLIENLNNVEIKNENDVETGFDLYNQLEINYENVENTGRKKIGEIEITRFITRVGAELRNDYNSFKDLRRDFNLLELINTKYSSKHELGTLHPKILELFGKEASKKTNLDIYDVNFYVNCLNESVERDIIIAYINLKLEMEQKNYSNEELYQYLVKILDNLGKDREIIQKKRVVPRKITIE